MQKLPILEKQDNASIFDWARKLTRALQSPELNVIPRAPSFLLAGLPSPAAAGQGALIYVLDAAGGPVPTYSDGTDWRRFDDNAVVS